MKSKPKPPRNIDEYVKRFPADVQRALQLIRRTIKKAAPRAQETISYEMPTFKQNGRGLVSFGAYKSHIGMYAAPFGIPAFKKDLARYGSGKGTLRFPLEEPMPTSLITRLVKYRVKENLARAAGRKAK